MTLTNYIYSRLIEKTWIGEDLSEKPTFLTIIEYECMVWSWDVVYMIIRSIISRWMGMGVWMIFGEDNDWYQNSREKKK